MNQDPSRTSGQPASGRRLPEPMSGVLSSLPASPSLGTVVDALVPVCADLAWISVEIDGHLRVSAYTHIDPRRMSALADFQELYIPSVDDEHSLMARVFRTGRPELVRPDALAVVERRVSNPGTRAALAALGARTSLMAPIVDAAHPARTRAIIVTAMSSSARMVNDDDLADLAQFALLLSPRLRL